MSDHYRLYIVTGKGGVGKSTVALSLAQYLSQQGKNVLFISMQQGEELKTAQKLNIPSRFLCPNKSTQTYIARKLNSATLAKWITKTPFFNSLFNMVPGLSQLILLGNILDMLEQDKSLNIVLDSPASGHVISLFESSHNFKKIFGEGSIVEDINKMHHLAYKTNMLKCIIVTIPTEMGISEGLELKTTLSKYEDFPIQILVNGSLYNIPELTNKLSSLPQVLRRKIQLEQELIQNNSELKLKSSFPQILDQENEEIVRKLTPLVGRERLDV